MPGVTIKYDIIADKPVATKEESKEKASKIAVAEALASEDDDLALMDALPMATILISPAFAKDNGVLASKHPHPLDATIYMNEKHHRYFVQWGSTGDFECKETISVSGFVHDFFPTFDADAIIAKMMRGRGFSSGKYAGLSPEEIKNQWNANGLKASGFGTSCHELLEFFLNGRSFTEDELQITEIQQFMRFYENFLVKRNMIPYRTEWRLRTTSDVRLVGTLDLICIDPDQDEEKKELRLILIDHKFSKEIKLENKYQRGLGVCAHLDDCNYAHYSLAMNSYKWILENFYHNVKYNDHVYPRVKVTSMYLDVFHNTHEDYQIFHVGDMQTTIEHMIEQRKSTLRASQADSGVGGP